MVYDLRRGCIVRVQLRFDSLAAVELLMSFSVGALQIFSMTPQWRGLVNGTIIYIVLGFIAGFCRMFVSKTNQP